jgi:hypothetical protein
MSEDDDTTEGTGEEASQESGAKEEWTQQTFELSPHELDDHNDAPKSYWLDRRIGCQNSLILIGNRQFASEFV